MLASLSATFSLALLPLACGTPAPAPPAPALFQWIDLHPEQGPLPGQLAAHCAHAAAAGQVPIAELTATWCAPCVALRKSLTDPAMQQALQGAYVLSLDVDQWGNALTDAGLSAYGVPMLFALAPGECAPTGLTLTGGAWEQDTPAAMAPVLQRFVAEARGG